MLAAYALLVLLPAVRHPDTHGFAAYYAAARVLLTAPTDLARVYDNTWFQSQIDADGFRHVRDIYNVQPPTMALLLTPFAWLPPETARALWVAVGAICWVLGCRSLARALGITSKDGHATLLVVAATSLFLPLRDNFRQGQCYAFLFFLLALHLELDLRRDSRSAWLAGLPLGAMLILKQAGVWLALLLLLSGRWRTVLAAAATTLAVAVLVSPWVGTDAWSAFLAALPSLAHSPERYVSAYQTVGGLFGHLFVYDATSNPEPAIHMPILAPVATATVVLIGIVQSVRLGRLSGSSHAEGALSLGMFAALIVTVAPIAESYHYCLVLPSLIIAWWWAFTTRSPATSWVVLTTATLLLTTTYSMYGWARIQAGGWALFAYPRVYGAFLLWGWLGSAVAALPRRHGAATLSASAAPL